MNNTVCDDLEQYIATQTNVSRKGIIEKFLKSNCGDIELFINEQWVETVDRENSGYFKGFGSIYCGLLLSYSIILNCPKLIGDINNLKIIANIIG